VPYCVLQTQTHSSKCRRHTVLHATLSYNFKLKLQTFKVLALHISAYMAIINCQISCCANLVLFLCSPMYVLVCPSVIDHCPCPTMTACWLSSVYLMAYGQSTSSSRYRGQRLTWWTEFLTQDGRKDTCKLWLNEGWVKLVHLSGATIQEHDVDNVISYVPLPFNLHSVNAH
jgi:hypothetical protein